MVKLLQEGKERKWYLIDEWQTSSGLKARVHQCVWNKEIKDLAPSIHDFYTGYVQVPEGVKPNEEQIEVHGGVTFSLGTMKNIEGMDGQWIGFDISHYGDENHQDINYAKSECEKLATQIK